MTKSLKYLRLLDEYLKKLCEDPSPCVKSTSKPSLHATSNKLDCKQDSFFLKATQQYKNYKEIEDCDFSETDQIVENCKHDAEEPLNDEVNNNKALTSGCIQESSLIKSK